MIRAFPILILTLATLAARALSLAWEYPAADEVTFTVYRSGDLVTWQPLTNTGKTNIALAVVPGKAFYYVTASNFWGESDPSNTVGTPAIAQHPSGLTITR